jgi:hypothetical protein
MSENNREIRCRFCGEQLSDGDVCYGCHDRAIDEAYREGYNEINEAKWFIFKAIQYIPENPECPFKQVCQYYKKVVKTHYWSDKG